MERNLEKYRAGVDERARTDDLLRLLPKGRQSVLDVGARDGYFSRLLAKHFTQVTALDLQRPTFEIPRVVAVAGDVTKLDFPPDSFDCIFCAEVLEHVPDLQRACNEIKRVARHEIIIGVPFKQDVRIGRCTCHSCGKVNPPWGHVNTFDSRKLMSLFPGRRLIRTSHVGTVKESTNFITTSLMDLAGNPWGTYDQDERCIYCGGQMKPPETRRMWQRGLSGIAVRLNRIQALFTRSHAKWVHLLFSKCKD